MLSLFLSLIEEQVDKTNFEKLYNTYHPTMLKIAYKITNNTYDAEKALSNAFFAIAKNINKIDFSNQDSVKALVCKIVRNTAINVTREKQREATVNIDDMFFIHSSHDIVASLENKEMCIALINKINTMSYVYKDVLTLYYLHGYSVLKISSLLQRNANTVRTQLKRGTKILRDFILEAGFNG